MNRAKSAAALVSGVLAFTAIAAVPHGYSLSPAKPQAAYSATINELEYTLERNTTLTWQFSAGVTDASSSDTSVCTVTVVEQDSIEIRPTGSGYADVTVNTPMDYFMSYTSLCSETALQLLLKQRQAPSPQPRQKLPQL